MAGARQKMKGIIFEPPIWETACMEEAVSRRINSVFLRL